MSNKKTEFESKSIPRELIFDNDNSYQAKDVFRGDYKSSQEREVVRKKKERANNDAFIGKVDKEG